jgi:predicted MPP superfamily phosphohydrolase
MNWLNLLILMLLTVGHTEVLVTLINRIESFPFPKRVLRSLRLLEDLVIISFPIVAVICVGLGGAGVLRGGAWSNLSTPWIVYFSICAAGCVGLVISTFRWWVLRPPTLQLSNHSRTVDVAQTLGYQPVGRGLVRVFARLPRNEIFQVQVSDKRYALPRVPAAWGELSILHLTDTHFTGKIDRPYFDEVAKLAEQTPADLIVFTGDLLDDIDLLPWLTATIGRLKAPLGCYYVLGNHDWFYGADKIRAEFDRCGWHNVAGQVTRVEHRGAVLEIAGTERPWMGRQPQFAPANDGFRVLLSHTPDHFAWARRQGVDVMLAGHNHGGQIVLPVIGPVFGPSRHGVRYAGGAFWEDPTLLYVSRGLSGRRLLRFNCPPELTRLILTPPAPESPSPDGTPPWAGG